MSEHNRSSRRLLALTRYLSALEQGDIETLAEVLREACSDPLLSELLEEMDSLYLELDQAALAPLEKQQIGAGVFQASSNHHQAEVPNMSFSPVSARDIVPVPGTIAAPGVSKARFRIEDQPTRPLRVLKRRRLAEPSSSRRPAWQLLAALLIICLLVGSMAAVLQVLHQQNGTGSQSLSAGQTLYSKQINSIAGNVASIAWSPDGKRLASLAFNGVQLWDATTGEHATLASIPASFGTLQSLTWSPNGNWIAVAAYGGIALIDAQSGRLAHEYTIKSLAADSGVSGTPNSNSFVSGLAWSPDSGQLAVTDYIATTGAGQDNFLIIDARTGQPVHLFDLMRQTAVVASWSPDGKYLAARVKGSYVWVWDTASFQVVMQQGLDGAQANGNVMPGLFAWQPGTDNVLFATGNLFQGVWVGLEAPSAVLWNVPQHKLVKQYDIKNTGFFSWSANGHYFATGFYGGQKDMTGQPAANQVAVFDASSAQQIADYDQQEWQVLDVVWSPDGRYLASCGSSYVRTWKL